MISAYRTVMRRQLPLLLVVCSALAHAAELPTGRYRCYQPPAYTVTAWFDILPDGTYSFQGEPPARFSYEPKNGAVRWQEGVLATRHGGGRYVPPSPQKGGGLRHTIVLESRDAAAPAADECYLTTH